MILKKHLEQFEISGKKALVTGGGSGIGMNAALELARRGALAVLVDINGESLKKAEELFRSKGHEVYTFVADITDIDAVRLLEKQLGEKDLSPDILINSAGVALVAHVDSTTYEDWVRVINLNLMGTINTISVFYPGMARRGFGHIVNISSLLGVFPMPSHGPYAASKCAVAGLSETLCYDLREHNIGVTLVCPGMVNTPLIGPATFRDLRVRGGSFEFPEGMMKKFILSPEKLANSIADAIRDNRFLVVKGAGSYLLYSFRRHFPRLWTLAGSSMALMFGMQLKRPAPTEDKPHLAAKKPKLRILPLPGKGVKDLQGKTVLVTGGASGIGLGAALEFAGRGCGLVLVDINQDSLDNAERVFESRGFKAETCRVDVTDINAVKELKTKLGKDDLLPDIVVNSAGIALIAHSDFLEYRDWKRTIDINLMGAVNFIYTFYPSMALRGGGHIVNVCSIGGLVPLPSLTTYCTSKFGVLGLSETLRFDLQKYNIGISAICPGGVNTPLFSPMPVRGFNFDEKKFEKYGPKMMKALISPEKLAVYIADGVVKNKFIVIPGLPSRALESFRRHFPNAWRRAGVVMAWLMKGLR
ncbi:MAG: SDR family NAD(P)-dependent oxidoreductase [Actinobacteria bacterium]|nr:SDR family NAD(P)-dependent oxidoreductase [Actinomycetota bacterium]